MFALAIWDVHNQELLIAGMSAVSNLFWAHTSMVDFASERKAFYPARHTGPVASRSGLAASQLHLVPWPIHSPSRHPSLEPGGLLKCVIEVRIWAWAPPSLHLHQ